jgi:hypothetical protein
MLGPDKVALPGESPTREQLDIAVGVPLLNPNVPS